MIKQTRKNKVLGILLTGTLAFGMAPTAAFANDELLDYSAGACAAVAEGDSELAPLWENASVAKKAVTTKAMPGKWQSVPIADWYDGHAVAYGLLSPDSPKLPISAIANFNSKVVPKGSRVCICFQWNDTELNGQYYGVALYVNGELIDKDFGTVIINFPNFPSKMNTANDSYRPVYDGKLHKVVFQNVVSGKKFTRSIVNKPEVSVPVAFTMFSYDGDLDYVYVGTGSAAKKSSNEVTLKKLSPLKKGFKVQLSGISKKNPDGYLLRYSTSALMTGAKVKAVKSTSKSTVVKGLKSGKTYYVQVITCKKANSDQYLSETAVGTVKTK